MPVLLDLFCGRWGWSKAFARRGWKCVGVDLVKPLELPDGCEFWQADILDLVSPDIFADFIVASSPCEQFSVHGMKHFHPNPPYPALGIKLFNHTRQLCEASGLPYVMENVRAAQQFVGRAVHHCGPFYLWGNAVPPIMPQGIKKGVKNGSEKCRLVDTVKAATIPPELANAVANYAERILEQRDQKVANSTQPSLS